MANAVQIAVYDDSGDLINPEGSDQVLTYNADGTVATISFRQVSSTYTQTFTYTAGNLIGISKWVKS